MKKQVQLAQQRNEEHVGSEARMAMTKRREQKADEQRARALAAKQKQS